MIFEDRVCFCGLDGLERFFMESSFTVMRESLLVAGTMYIGLGLN